MPDKVLAPWIGFLRDVDRALNGRVEVHCLGGFVMAVRWNLPRPTGDVDFVEIKPSDASQDLLRLAGQGSEIARTHSLYFHRVTVAEYPEGYASRLTDLTPRGFKRLRLRAFDVHDLVLAKLGRNSARDRADVAFLVQKGKLDLNEERHVATLRLWLDEFFDAQG